MIEPTQEVLILPPNPYPANPYAVVPDPPEEKEEYKEESFVKLWAAIVLSLMCFATGYIVGNPLILVYLWSMR